MNTYSDKVVFIEGKNKKFSPKFKFGFSIFLMIVFALSFFVSLYIKIFYDIPELTKEEAYNIISSNLLVSDDINEAIVDAEIFTSAADFTSLSEIKELSKIDKRTTRANADIIFNFANLEIPINCNFIFIYENNQWLIYDITNLEAGEGSITDYI